MKHKSMHIPILIILCFAALYSNAQGGYNKNDFKTVSGSLFLTTITGEPINTNKYVRLVEGTPYFQDQWMQSIIVLQDGKRTQNVMTKLNLVENEIYFRDTKGRELVVTQPVQEVVLMNKAEDSLFRFVNAQVLDKSAKKGWYQWPVESNSFIKPEGHVKGFGAKGILQEFLVLFQLRGDRQ